jgi:hypothetical protein
VGEIITQKEIDAKKEINAKARRAPGSLRKNLKYFVPFVFYVAELHY